MSRKEAIAVGVAIELAAVGAVFAAFLVTDTVTGVLRRTSEALHRAAIERHLAAHGGTL